MVSNLGMVKSLNYKNTGREEVLTPAKNSKGYLRVSLHKNGKERKLGVHRLVWEAFKGPIPKGMQINHLNEEKTDNHLENLSLVTPKENCNWGTRNKRIWEKVSKSRRKMVEQYTLEGEHIMTWFSVTGIEEEVGYGHATISKCCSGKLKTAYEYIWRYTEK